jgi:heme-degrading monooxygenase HmoA
MAMGWMANSSASNRFATQAPGAAASHRAEWPGLQLSKPRFSALQEAVMLQRIEMDQRVPLADQLAEEVGPVTLINTFTVAPEDADALLEAWAADAAYLKIKPGFISTQLYRGIGGSGVFINQAVWESVEAFRDAFGDPQFQATFARYPDSTVASPHLFQKVAVPGHLRGPLARHRQQLSTWPRSRRCCLPRRECARRPGNRGPENRIGRERPDLPEVPRPGA